MLGYLSLTDMFLVGLALDICGAVLLARGLLLSPEAISWVSGTYWGLNRGAMLDRCQNRVLGEFGIAYLGGGFIFQALGYALDIDGAHAKTGGSRLIAGLTMAAVAAAIAVTAYALLHGVRERRLLGSVESANAAREAHQEKRKKQERAEREADAI